MGVKTSDADRRLLRRGLVLFAALQLADVPLTAVALAHGAVEVNPLMTALLAHGQGFIVAEAFKLLIVAGLASTTAALWRVYPRYARAQLVALVIVSALLVVVSIGNIVRAA